MANMNMGAALIKSGRCDEAVIYYESALHNQPDFTDAMPQLAWILAAHPDPRVRNGKRAVEIAERLCRTVPGNPNDLDVSAAAYAETGDWHAAADASQRALDSCQRMLDTLPLDLQGRKNLTDAMIVMQSHLQSYEEKQPIRDASLVQPRP